MPKRSPQELNARDAERIEKRRRALARAKDLTIGDLEHLRTDLIAWSSQVQADGFDSGPLVAAAGTLAAYIDHRIDQALAGP